MNSQRVRVLIGLIAFWIGSNSVVAAGWKFGAAKTKITPQRAMMMSGYASRDRPNDAKLTELWAKALVLEDDRGKRVCVVTADLIGVSRDFTSGIVKRLEERHSIGPTQFMICTSHTHTGPAVANTLVPMYAVVSDSQQTKIIEDYTEQLQQTIVDLVGEAVAELQSGRLTWGSGRATFATNRRNNRPEQEVPHRRRMQTLQGPFDHDVPVLAVHDAQDNLCVLLFGYACHATVLSSYEWSGDYPGFAQAELEEGHDGCQAMFWAGCGADQNPLPRRSHELAKHYGRRLAAAVNEVLLTTEMVEVAPQIATNYRVIDLGFDTLPDETQLRSDLASRDRFVAGRAKLLLEQIETGVPLSKTYPYPITVWKLGHELQWIGLGGEVVVDFALRLKRQLSQQKTWVAAYTNDVMAYIPSRRVWEEGGYEGGGAMVYYGLPARWDAQVEERIVESVLDMAQMSVESQDAED